MHKHRMVKVNNTTVWLKLFPGKGPHAGQWKIYWNNKWHHYKWAPKKEIQNDK